MTPIEETAQPERDKRRVLTIALALNAAMFAVELVAGLWGESSGLLADSLDMLTDATAYGLALMAIGRSPRFKAGTAAFSGWVLLILGIGILLDVLRRVLQGSEPVSPIMITVAALALVVNATVLRMLYRHRHGEVHLRAVWICTRADVIANLGVIVAGIAVLMARAPWPDWVVGTAIGLYVIKEAREIIETAGRGNTEG